MAAVHAKAPPDTAVPPGPADPGPEDDAEVIARSRDEPEAFGAIFDAYFTEIHRYAARRIDTDTADDIAAETFAIAFRRRHDYDMSRPNARPWLYGIATRLIGRHRRDERRKLRALERHGVEEPAGHEDEIAAQIASAQVRGPLAKALAALPAAQRDVLLLVVLAGLAYEDVSAALGVPYGTVASTWSDDRPPGPPGK